MPSDVAEVRTIRLVVVEDEPLFRDLLVSALEASGEFVVEAAFDSGEAAFDHVVEIAPDVAVLDINLAGSMNGVQLGVQLRRAVPTIGIMLLSSLADPTVLASLPPDVAGGWSYLLKGSASDVESVARAIRGAASGLMVIDPVLIAGVGRDQSGPITRLTARQVEVLQLIAEGYTNRAIAERMYVTEKSVENHLSRVYSALDIDASDKGMHPRVQAVLMYLQSLQA